MMNVIREDQAARDAARIDLLEGKVHILELQLANVMDNYVEHLKSCPRRYQSAANCDCGLSSLRRRIDANP